jgi:hypothetical protein
VKYKDLFVSIPKSLETDPMSITLEQSIELIKAKQEANANKYIHEFTHD